MSRHNGPRRVLLIQGHPDTGARHLLHALAAAYAEAARAAGHAVLTCDVARLDFPLLRSADDWKHGPTPKAIEAVQQDVLWADHLVFFFPLWLGDMPALLKAFLEQLARPGFAFKRMSGGSREGNLEDGGGNAPADDQDGGNPFAHKALRGRSARVIVTMGMPALVYRWIFRAHSVRALERNILGFVGIAPVRETLIGGVEGLGEAGVQRWLGRMRTLGQEAE